MQFWLPIKKIREIFWEIERKAKNVVSVTTVSQINKIEIKAFMFKIAIWYLLIV